MMFDLNTMATILMVVFVIMLVIDPFLIFLLVAALFEHRLKKRLPNASLTGINLYEYALSHDENSIRKIAKYGVIAQLVYCLLWCVFSLFMLITSFGREDELSWAIVVFLIIFGLFIWFAYRFSRLLWFKN